MLNDRAKPKYVRRPAATIVGVLYIVAAVPAVLALALYQPILTGPNYLVQGAAHANQVLLGALLELVVVASVAGTAIGLFPFLRRHNEHLALAYFCFRFLEAILITIGIVAVLSLLSVSRAFVAVGAPNAGAYQAVGTALIAVHAWTFMLGPDFMLGLNTSIYSFLFFRSRMVPRPLAILGLVGAALVFLAALLELFGVVDQVSALGALLAVPVALYEMSLAVWLIVKGFNSAAVIPPIRA